MVKLIATKRVRDLTEIDFDCLSIAISQIIQFVYGKCPNATLRVHKNAHMWDGFYLKRNLIKLSLREKRDVLDLIASLLHEIRHWMQKRIFKQDVASEIHDSNSDWDAYFNSAIEQDARKFEEHAEDVLKIYKSLLRIRKKEHSQNVGVRKNNSNRKKMRIEVENE